MTGHRGAHHSAWPPNVDPSISTDVHWPLVLFILLANLGSPDLVLSVTRLVPLSVSIPYKTFPALARLSLCPSLHPLSGLRLSPSLLQTHNPL